MRKLQPRVDFDAVGSEGYDPTAEVPTPAGVRTRSNHRAYANSPYTPDGGYVGQRLTIPDPSVGGQWYQGPALGWNTGLSPYGTLSQPFSGATLTISPMGANPREGNVGYTTRSQRLRNGVLAGQTDYTPAPSAIQQAWLKFGG